MAGALSKMSRLRLLILKDVHFSENLNSISNELRYIEWDGYPFMYLPSSFLPNQLVQLKLKQSNMKQLWNNYETTWNNMKQSAFWHHSICQGWVESKNLIEMPNFEEVPNLEILRLEGCANLLHLDLSIGVLRKLCELNLKGCKKLRSIPKRLMIKVGI